MHRLPNITVSASPATSTTHPHPHQHGLIMGKKQNKELKRKNMLTYDFYHNFLSYTNKGRRQTTICDLSHSVCRSPLTDLGHISSVTYICHPLWFVCGHRKMILTSPLNLSVEQFILLFLYIRMVWYTVNYKSLLHSLSGCK